MPYLTRDQLQIVMRDLPESHVPGRSGQQAHVRVSSAYIMARAIARAVHVKFAQTSPTGESKLTVEERRSQNRKRLRQQLGHLRYDTEHMKMLVKKYEVLPDHYYKDEVGVAPQDLLDDDYMTQHGYRKWSPEHIWEWVFRECSTHSNC